MKVLVTGASGLLGWDIADAFEAHGHEVARLMGRKDVNMLKPNDVMEYVRACAPDVVVHSAGYRDLDAMERHEYDGFAVNSFGTRNIALACRACDCKLVYISSDTVFDGEKGTGYHEFDMPCPVNVYGRSKLMAEREIHNVWDKSFIVRTALLFGYKGHRENSFIFHIVDELRAGRTVQASTDQVCCPSYTADLAEAIHELSLTEWYGTYHIANTGIASRCDVSRAVALHAGLDPEMVVPATSTEAKYAKRAKNTTFSSIAWPATFGSDLPDWRDALGRCMDEMKSLGLLEVSAEA